MRKEGLLSLTIYAFEEIITILFMPWSSKQKYSFLPFLLFCMIFFMSLKNVNIIWLLFKQCFHISSNFPLCVRVNNLLAHYVVLFWKLLNFDTFNFENLKFLPLLLLILYLDHFYFYNFLFQALLILMTIKFDPIWFWQFIIWITFSFDHFTFWWLFMLTTFHLMTFNFDLF